MGSFLANMIKKKKILTSGVTDSNHWAWEDLWSVLPTSVISFLSEYSQPRFGFLYWSHSSGAIPVRGCVRHPSVCEHLFLITSPLKPLAECLETSQGCSPKALAESKRNCFSPSVNITGGGNLWFFGYASPLELLAEFCRNLALACVVLLWYSFV